MSLRIACKVEKFVHDEANGLHTQLFECMEPDCYYVLLPFLNGRLTQRVGSLIANGYNKDKRNPSGEVLLHKKEW